jgi:hypothetical protein
VPLKLATQCLSDRRPLIGARSNGPRSNSGIPSANDSWTNSPTESPPYMVRTGSTTPHLFGPKFMTRAECVSATHEPTKSVVAFHNGRQQTEQLPVLARISFSFGFWFVTVSLFCPPGCILVERPPNLRFASIQRQRVASVPWMFASGCFWQQSRSPIHQHERLFSAWVMPCFR